MWKFSATELQSYRKTCISDHSKEDPNICFQYDIRLMKVKVLQNASAILSTCTKLPSVFKTFVSSIFEWLLKTGYTVFLNHLKFADNGISIFSLRNKGLIFLICGSSASKPFTWNAKPYFPKNQEKYHKRCHLLQSDWCLNTIKCVVCCSQTGAIMVNTISELPDPGLGTNRFSRWWRISWA